MPDQHPPARCPRWLFARTFLVLTVGVAVVPGLALAGADEKPAPARPEGRAVVAKCVTETASLLRREGSGKPWQIVHQDEALSSGDLLLGATDAALEAGDGAVRLSFQGDLSGTSPFPIIETAVILHQDPDVDLDFTLERGRVDLTNRKEKGSARVRVRIENHTGELVLSEPGTRVALEVYGRWPKGVPFRKDPGPDDRPALGIVILVLKGEVVARGEKRQLVLSAPPGPAMLQGNNIHDTDPAPQHLDKLPSWATNEDTDKAKRIRAVLARFRQLAVAKSIPEALAELMDSENLAERRAAVFLMGAMDDLTGLGKALSQATQQEVWDAGVLALRHWIGRGPGQDQKLYRGLIEKGKIPPGQAETVLYLLHSFSAEDLARPETYEMLLDLLESDRLALRGLANWHLYRLVPEGRKFGYAPLASKEDRARAVAEWRHLIPAGQLPPKPRVPDR